MKVYSLALFTALAIFAILGASTIAADVPALFVESASETNAEAAATSVTQEWVTQYPGLRGVGIVVDAGNFIYVTGPSPNDASRNYRRNIVTVKYDQAGNQVWAREFDETDDATYGEDISNWLTLDPYGNVIVTGRSFINSTGDDFITLKYDPDGNLLWKARSDAGYEAVRVATDTAGNVYVTGRSSPSNSASNYATIKYDVNGNELWVRTYNGPNNFNDTPYALAVSAGGDVVVTGESTGGVSSFDIATIRYDTNGNELWVRRYNSPSDGQDSGNDVAFGANGEVYVGGHSVQNDFLDFTLIKYDVGGNEVWVRTFDGTRQWGDSIRRVGVDSQGNVVVTGYSQNMELGTVIATLKYDSNGNLLWQQLFDDPTGEDIPWGLAIGPDDAIYVTGDAGSDVGTVAYDANGNERWSVIYNNGTDRGYNVALDSENNVYVVGQEPIVTIRYTQTAGPEPTATPTSAATAAPTDTPVPIDTPEPTATLTATPSPTPEPTNTPTATATPGSATTIHVGDLDGASVNDGKTWIAYVTITIHDNNHNPVSNATVSGSWGNGASGSASCATNGSGQCTVSVSGIRKNVSSVTFTVNNVSHSTLSYDSGANHDPDGDSNGTSITISRS